MTYGESMLAELAAAAPDGISAAVDTAGQGFVERAASLVAPERIVTAVDFAAAAARGAVVAAGDPTELTAGTIGTVLDAVSRGTLEVAIDGTYPLERLPEALLRAESGQTQGKVIVSF